MFVYPDGQVTGSVHWADLADLVANKSDDSVTKDGYARLQALLDEHQQAVAGPAPADEQSAPSKSDNKAAWVDHAVAQGADPDEAESLTKAELQEQFGKES